MAVETVEFALGGGAHGAARTVHDVGQLGAATTALLEEFGEAGLEDAFHADRLALLARILVQPVEVGAAPEVLLEALAVAARRTQRAELADDQRPGQHRQQRQAQHDQLHHQTGVQDQAHERNRLQS